MLAGSGQLRNAVAKTSEHIVTRQQDAALEFDDHRFFHRCEHGAGGSARQQKGTLPPVGVATLVYDLIVLPSAQIDAAVLTCDQ